MYIYICMYANLYIFSLRQSLLYLFRKVMSWLQITLQALFSTWSHKEKWRGHNVVFCFRPLYLFTRSCLFKTLCHAKCTRQHGWYRGQRIVCHVLGYTMILSVESEIYCTHFMRMSLVQVPLYLLQFYR